MNHSAPVSRATANSMEIDGLKEYMISYKDSVQAVAEADKSQDLQLETLFILGLMLWKDLAGGG